MHFTVKLSTHGMIIILLTGTTSSVASSDSQSLLSLDVTSEQDVIMEHIDLSVSRSWECWSCDLL